MDKVAVQRGNVYKHFKRGHYVVECIAVHTESQESLVVYKCLETNKEWARPIDMFNSPVDKSEYPDVEQEYRFKYLGNINELDKVISKL